MNFQGTRVEEGWLTRTVFKGVKELGKDLVLAELHGKVLNHIV